MAVEEDVNIEFDPQSLELALEENKLTQAELARILGFTHRNVINKIIKGQRQPTANDLLRISAALGKPPAFFSKERKKISKTCY
jgi:transcriptional regulator with XRE-family HTH domain